MKGVKAVKRVLDARNGDDVVLGVRLGAMTKQIVTYWPLTKYEDFTSEAW